MAGRPGGILFVYRGEASFKAIDRGLLARRWPLEEWVPSRSVAGLAAVLRGVRRRDLVFGWFAGWHTALPVALAWLLRKPSVIVIGGVDVADLPAIGYGFRGPRKWVSRWVMRRASRLVTNSEFSRDEIDRNIGLPPGRVAVVHHGLPDPFASLPPGPRERMAVTVGVVDRRNLERKGQRAFVEAASLVPEVEFVLIGRWDGEAIDVLRASAPPNVTFTGWLPEERLNEYLAKAAVYVQASLHEGFGMSVAEAMLGGCVPVVTRYGALPEVVGEAGVQIATPSPRDVAAGVREALALGPDAARRARERILREFPLEARERGLYAVVEELIGSG